MQRNGTVAEPESAFPIAALEALRRDGGLRAPLPVALGGSGWGTEPAGAAAILALLRSIGRSSLPLGRAFEGHVNAIRLVVRYGTPAQAAAAAADAIGGHLFAIWAAENPDAPLRLVGDRLAGSKTFASGAGIVTRALVTAERETAGSQMVLVQLAPGEGFDGSKIRLQGMRGAGTGVVRLDGIAAPESSWIGAAGDYMRQPEISLGAWRTLAVQLGGLDALLDALRTDLVGRGRDGDPYQLARVGQALIARETARLWLEHTAALAESDDAAALEDAANLVKLARLAVEAAVLDALRLAQQSVGIAAFIIGHPIERLSRDLGTYLRQPAMDMVLAEAAEHFMRRDPP
jgi:alkylation response protein AidB-like acyl-CoA dehydrogenase